MAFFWEAAQEAANPLDLGHKCVCPRLSFLANIQNVLSFNTAFPLVSNVLRVCWASSETNRRGDLFPCSSAVQM